MAGAVGLFLPHCAGGSHWQLLPARRVSLILLTIREGSCLSSQFPFLCKRPAVLGHFPGSVPLRRLTASQNYLLRLPQTRPAPIPALRLLSFRSPDGLWSAGSWQVQDMPTSPIPEMHQPFVLWPCAHKVHYYRPKSTWMYSWQWHQEDIL